MNQRSRRRAVNRDYRLVGLIGLLALIGIVVIYTISPALNYNNADTSSANTIMYRHLLNTAVGFVGFVAASRIKLDTWRKLLPGLIILSVVTSILLLIPATNLTINGATRWIGFGSFSFQPAELIKLTLILYLGFLLANKPDKEVNDLHATIIPVGILLAVLGVLVVVIQRDLGTMVVVAMITVGMLYFRGLSFKYLGMIVAGMLGAAVLAVAAFPHRLSRIMTFLDPSADALGAGYHVDQALTAIGSGGLFGRGIGRSVQVYGYLPEAENDSVFAIISEIFGFLGSIGILLLLGYLLFRIMKTAENQSTTAGQLIACGVLLWLSAHVVINIGAMLALLPLTGLTLPFLSYGGSSLLFMMIALGIIFQLSSSESRENGSATANYQTRRTSRAVKTASPRRAATASSRSNHRHRKLIRL